MFQTYGDFSYFDYAINVTPLYQPDGTFEPLGDSEVESISSETYATMRIRQATYIAILCGIVLNGTFALICIRSLLSTPRSGPYTRLWLTFAMMVTHTLQLITQFLNMYIFPQSLRIEDQLLGMLIDQIPDCLNLVAVLTGVLLTYNIFRAVNIFHATTGTGRRSAIKWVSSTAGAWIVGFAVILSITLPMVNSHHGGGGMPHFTSIILLLVEFIFPYLFSLLLTCLSLRRYFKVPSTTHAAECSNEPDNFQNNDNTPGTDGPSAVNDGRESKDANSKKSMTCWVIFNAVVVFLGFLIRLPLHLFRQDAFRQTMFTDYMISYVFYNASYFGSFVFIAVFPLLCLIIMEVRKVRKGCVCKLCFKLLCSECCPENGDEEDE